MYFSLWNPIKNSLSSTEQNVLQHPTQCDEITFYTIPSTPYILSSHPPLFFTLPFQWVTCQHWLLKHFKLANVIPILLPWSSALHVGFYKRGVIRAEFSGMLFFLPLSPIPSRHTMQLIMFTQCLQILSTNRCLYYEQLWRLFCL